MSDDNLLSRMIDCDKIRSEQLRKMQQIRDY